MVSEISETDMPTPQITAAAPTQLCPLCGRRMQHCGTSETTHNYACFQHDVPFYLNVHHKFMDEHGRIREAIPRERNPYKTGKETTNYDPRLARKSS